MKEAVLEASVAHKGKHHAVRRESGRECELLVWIWNSSSYRIERVAQLLQDLDLHEYICGDRRVSLRSPGSICFKVELER